MSSTFGNIVLSGVLGKGNGSDEAASGLSEPMLDAASEQEIRRLQEEVRSLQWRLAIQRAATRRIAERITGHLSYRLGSAVVQNVQSLRGLVRLPFELLSAYKEFRAEKLAARPRYKLVQPGPLHRDFTALLEERGSHGLVAHVATLGDSDRQRIDDASYGLYICALRDALDLRGCVAAFEHRYEARDLEVLAGLDPRVVQAYIRSLIRCDGGDKALDIVRGLVEADPLAPEFASLLGYVTAGHDPAGAREHLGRAIYFGRRSLADLGLIFRTLQVEGEPMQHILPEMDVFGGSGGQSASMSRTQPFILSAVAMEAGDTQAALAEVASYYERAGLAPVRLIAADQPFGIDNFAADTHGASTDGPLVSVLMTTYNSAEYLDTAVRSVLEQTYRSLELIVVDDCSVDGTREKLAEWVLRDERVKVLHNVCNVGTYGAKNLALLHARGAYITCHDSDDWSHPQKIACQVDRLQSSDALACISQWVRIDERGYFECPRWGSMIHINPSSLLYKREVVEAMGFYDLVRTGADTEFHNRIINRFGKKAVCELREAMALGRARSDSLTRASIGFDDFGASPVRQAYWESWGAWHRRLMLSEPEKLYVAFPPSTQRPFPAPPEIEADVAGAHANVAACPPPLFNWLPVVQQTPGGLGKAAPTRKISMGDLASLPQVPIGVDHSFTENEAIYAYEEGRFTYHMLFKRSSEHSNRLFVLFSGDARGAKGPPPVFQRWTWANRFPGHTLFVSDPTLLLDEKLTLAWYAGVSDEDPMPVVARLVAALAQKLGVQPADICSYGSSGGGFAATRLSLFLPEIQVVAINPQTDVTKYQSNISRFLKVFSGNPSRDHAAEHFSDRLSLLRHLEALKQRRIFYLQNVQDTHHVDAHFAPFAAQLGLARDNGFRKGAVRTIFFDHEGGHKAAEIPEVFDMVMDLIKRGEGSGQG